MASITADALRGPQPNLKNTSGSVFGTLRCLNVETVILPTRLDFELLRLALELHLDSWRSGVIDFHLESRRGCG